MMSRSKVDVTENYMALAVSILGNCPPDTAFRRLGETKKRPQRHIQWSRELTRKAAELKSSGMSWKEVFDALDIETGDQERFKAVVYNREEVKRQTPRWTPDKVRKVKRMKASGMTAAEIGKEFDASQESIYYVLKK